MIVDSKRGRLATAALIAVAALAIGALFGAADNGDAASASKPSNLTPPTISGKTSEGSTLTAGNGTWDGTTPLTFAYTWSRCDESGGSCAAISGATASTYVLKHVDAGATLRVTVKATNGEGSAESTSVPTAVVSAAPTPPTPAPTGCPGGNGTIAIGDVSAPARLALDGQSITPGVVTPSSSSIQVRFRVTACGGRPVQGALLYATAVPYNQYTVPAEEPTGADGTATLTMTQLRGFPAARQQQLLVVFARARKAGEPINGGISSRRLVSFPVSLH